MDAGALAAGDGVEERLGRAGRGGADARARHLSHRRRAGVRVRRSGDGRARKRLVFGWFFLLLPRRETRRGRGRDATTSLLPLPLPLLALPAPRRVVVRVQVFRAHDERGRLGVLAGVARRALGRPRRAGARELSGGRSKLPPRALLAPACGPELARERARALEKRGRRAGDERAVMRVTRFAVRDESRDGSPVRFVSSRRFVEGRFRRRGVVCVTRFLRAFLRRRLSVGLASSSTASLARALLVRAPHRVGRGEQSRRVSGRQVRRHQRAALAPPAVLGERVAHGGVQLLDDARRDEGLAQRDGAIFYIHRLEVRRRVGHSHARRLLRSDHAGARVHLAHRSRLRARVHRGVPGAAAERAVGGDVFGVGGFVSSSSLSRASGAPSGTPSREVPQ